MPIQINTYWKVKIQDRVHKVSLFNRTKKKILGIKIFIHRVKFCLSVRNSKLNFKKMKVIDINENIPGVKVYFVKI